MLCQIGTITYMLSALDPPQIFGLVTRAHGVASSVNGRRVMEDSIATKALRSELHSGIFETGCCTCGLTRLNGISCHENGGVQSSSIGVVRIASQTPPAYGGFDTTGSVAGLAPGTTMGSVAPAVSKLTAAISEAAATAGRSAVVITAKAISRDRPSCGKRVPWKGSWSV